MSLDVRLLERHPKIMRNVQRSRKRRARVAVLDGRQPACVLRPFLRSLSLLPFFTRSKQAKKEGGFIMAALTGPEEYGLDGYAWSMMFVMWCLSQAGASPTAGGCAGRAGNIT